MFCDKANLNELEKLQERVLRFVFRDIAYYMKPYLNGDISVRYQCTESSAWPFKSLNALMGIIPLF